MQIPYLARHCRVVAFDGRGNGRSDRPRDAAAYDEREFAADALAVMDATKTERAVDRRALPRRAARPAACGRASGARRRRRLHRAEFPRRRLTAARADIYDFDDRVDTDEGWAKHNRHYWLRDYRDFVEFFFAKWFTEPHSTKPIEDAVGWGLETDAETMIATMERPRLDPGRVTATLCSKCALPRARDPRRATMRSRPSPAARRSRSRPAASS